MCGPHLRLEPYSADYLPNPFPDPGNDEVAWEEFIAVRNHVFDALVAYGPVGPLGKGRILRSLEDDALDVEWETNLSTYTFHLVDELWSMDKYIYVEIIDPQCLRPEVVTAVAEVLADTDGWGLCVNNIPDGYMIVFADRICLTGTTFSGAQNLKDVAQRAVRALLSRRRSG